MTVTNFSEVQKVYGTYGRKHIEELSDICKAKGMSIHFDALTMDFSVLNSKQMSSLELAMMLSKKKVVFWELQMSDRVTSVGNKIFRLRDIDPTDFSRWAGGNIDPPLSI